MLAVKASLGQKDVLEKSQIKTFVFEGESKMAIKVG